MKKILMCVMALFALCFTTSSWTMAAEDANYGYDEAKYGAPVKDACVNDSGYVGNEKLWSQVGAQSKAMRAALKAGDVDAAIRLNPLKYSMAWALNNTAYDLILEISGGMPFTDTKKASEARENSDYLDGESVQGKAKDALNRLEQAAALLKEAKDCKTSGSTQEEVQASIARCKEKVESNTLFCQRVLRIKDWPEAAK